MCIDLNTRGIRNEKTHDDVEFRFYDYYGDLISSRTVEGITRDFGSYWWCHTFDVRHVYAKSVQIENLGDDALMIDRMTMDWWVDDIIEAEWGVNNDKGWCLSTDPDDINGSWSDHANGCHECLEFRDDGKAYPC